MKKMYAVASILVIGAMLCGEIVEAGSTYYGPDYFYPRIPGSYWKWSSGASSEMISTGTQNGEETFTWKNSAGSVITSLANTTGIVEIERSEIDSSNITWTTIYTPFQLFLSSSLQVGAVQTLTSNYQQTSPSYPGYAWDGQVTNTNSLLSIENVTVTAGTFQNCLKVLRQSDWHSSNTNGQTAQGTGTFTTWFCQSIGVVKEESPTYSVPYKELVSYFIPSSSANLVISPTSQAVSEDAGSIAFSVTNTGTGTMPWTAVVASGSDWLTITSGSSGSNSGTTICSYTANTGTANRIATIRVTAAGATGSPVDVTVIQGAITTDCTATLDGNLSLHIPFLSYLIPYWGAPSYWADLVYEPNPAYPTWIPFKLINATIIQSGIFSCDASTLSDDLKVHIPDLLFPDGVTRMWVDMEYSSVLSTDSNAYFVVTNYGAASN
jgi:hypothetical protein